MLKFLVTHLQEPLLEDHPFRDANLLKVNAPLIGHRDGLLPRGEGQTLNVTVPLLRCIPQGISRWAMSRGCSFSALVA